MAAAQRPHCGQALRGLPPPPQAQTEPSLCALPLPCPDLPDLPCVLVCWGLPGEGLPGTLRWPRAGVVCVARMWNPASTPLPNLCSQTLSLRGLVPSLTQAGGGAVELECLLAIITTALIITIATA